MESSAKKGQQSIADVRSPPGAHSPAIEAEFDYDASWSKKVAALDPKEKLRVQQTLDMVPAEVRSMLDAGSGDGRISSHLTQRCLVVCVDISAHALRRNPNPVRTVGHLTQLPYSNGAVDLVLLSEVIEHIPARILPTVLGEIRRVARKYILITVPYRETLVEANVRCECGYVFHKWGHLARYDERALPGLYPDLPVQRLAHLGPPKPSNLDVAVALRQKLGGRYAGPEDDTICPKCSGRNFVEGHRNPVSMLFGGLNTVASRILPPRRATWIGALFQKA